MTDAISPDTAFDDACAALERTLTGSFRRDVVRAAAQGRTLGHVLRRLRDGMRVHAYRAGSAELDLGAAVRGLDARTRAEGFHALHDWDGKAGRFNDETIPVEVLNFIIRFRGDAPPEPAVAAILLDYHLMYVLALLSLRVWDTGDVNANLARLTTLLALLQGPDGSGQQFAADAETLLVIATSHYEPEERGYQMLFDRRDTLDVTHRARLGLVHASCMGGHLRFGFEATYGQDVMAMRDDNIADYPWLLFGLSALIREYARLHAAGENGPERDTVVEALLNGLATDPDGLLGDTPADAFALLEDERRELVEGMERFGAALAPAFAALRPLDRDYSPLSFFFNFSQNVVKGAVIDALLRGEARALTLNDMFTGLPAGALRNEARTRLATTLMSYARSSPDTVRGRPTPAIVYDPRAGRRAHAMVMKAIAD